MAALAAFLRAVNVGRRQLSMTSLVAACEECGFDSPRTHLRSGNVVFRSEDDPATVAATLEPALASASGFDVECMVRTVDQLDRVIAANPFPDAATERPGKLSVVFLEHAPSPTAASGLGDRLPGPEPVELIGTELYIDYVNGIGRSKLTAAAIEKALGEKGPRGTGRNWNTVLKVTGFARALAG